MARDSLPRSYVTTPLLLCASLPILASSRPEGLILAGAVALLVAADRFFFDQRYAATLLGMLVPLAPITGKSSLLACVFIFLLGRKEKNFRHAGWGAGLLLYYFVQAAIFGSSDLDPGGWAIIWNGADGPGASGFRNLWPAISLAPPYLIRAATAWDRMLALVLLTSLFWSDPGLRDKFCRGIYWGLIPSFLAGTLQLLGLAKSYFANINSFWEGQSRLAGGFSDPNAFGVFTALLLPIAAYELSRLKKPQRIAAWIAMALWVLLALHSGSRSLIMALIVYAAIWLYRRRSRAFKAMLGAGLLALLAWNLFDILWPAKRAELGAMMPSAADRFSESLLASKVEQSFFSRAVFLKVGWLVFRDHPFLGMGLGRFPDVVALYARRAGIEIGSWVDNSNNFYLGHLSEGGLVAALLLVVALAGLKFRETADGSSTAAKIALGVFCLMLFFGPHLDFDEVAVLAALAISRALSPRPERFLPTKALCLTAVAAAAAFSRAAFDADAGFHPWERERWQVTRWTGRAAKGHLACFDGRAILRFRADNPRIALHPVNVKIESSCGQSWDLRLRSSDLNELEMSCACSSSRIGYSAVSSRPWSPRKYSETRDARLLGLKIYGDPDKPLP